MTLGPHGTPEPERLLRVKIITEGAVSAPRPGHFMAFTGGVIDVIDTIARALVDQGSAELTTEDTTE